MPQIHNTKIYYRFEVNQNHMKYSAQHAIHPLTLENETSHAGKGNRVAKDVNVNGFNE
jgi:hypothetical protein